MSSKQQVSLNTEDETALEMVRRGYALDDTTDRHRVLDFRVTFTKVEAAFLALEEIGGYNGFDGASIAEQLRGIGLPDFTRISVGREGSPVLYVQMYSPPKGSLRDALSTADEFEERNSEFRAWWD